MSYFIMSICRDGSMGVCGGFYPLRDRCVVIADMLYAPISYVGLFFKPPFFIGGIFMTAIRINQLKITVGSRDLLDIKNLQVQANKRIGIVGKNGSGKSTLFKILAG